MAPMKNDALLDELNGVSTVKSTQLDPLPTKSQEDPLEVKPQAPAPAVQQSDAKHSIKKGGKGYAVTVRGQYYAPSKEFQGKRVVASYKVVVNLASLDSALSVIKNKLLDAAILKKHPESMGARTHEIVSAVPRSTDTPAPTNLQFMDMNSLAQYVQTYRVPVNVADYSDVTALRFAIIDFIQNPKGFEKREALRQKKREEDAELTALNPDLAPTD